MKKSIQTILACAAGMLVMAGSALAASSGNVPVTVNATVGAFAKLTIPNAISFNNADPDLVLSIPANENPVNVTTKVRTASGNLATLTVQAAGDLSNGTPAENIGIGAIAWTAAGDPGLVAGAMSTAGAVAAGSWTGSGSRSGQFNYAFANSWSYAPGNYAATVNYVLSAP